MELELPPNVIAAAQANRKIEAIKLLREHRGIGLQEAKGIIDAYCADNPELIRPQPQPGSGLGRLVLIVTLVVLFYGLYDYFVGTK